MSVNQLIPGRQYHSYGFGSQPRVYTFVKRLRRGREISGRTVNVFQCDDYRGQNGPADAGITHVWDVHVNRDIKPIGGKA